jgi:hypothetical protein
VDSQRSFEIDDIGRRSGQLALNVRTASFDTAIRLWPSELFSAEAGLMVTRSRTREPPGPPFGVSGLMSALQHPEEWQRR